MTTAVIINNQLIVENKTNDILLYSQNQMSSYSIEMLVKITCTANL